MVVIADDSKRVAPLGRVPAAGRDRPLRLDGDAARWSRELLAGMDVDGREVAVRMGKDGPLVTDEGNYILDLHLGRIGDAPALATALNALPGRGRARALHRHGALRGARPRRRHAPRCSTGRAPAAPTRWTSPS